MTVTPNEKDQNQNFITVLPKRIRAATLLKEFEQKYAEKEKLLQVIQYKLELKQERNDKNLVALWFKALNRANNDLLFQMQSITRDEIFHKIKNLSPIRINLMNMNNQDHWVIISLNIMKPTVLHQ